jgi:NTE family protein
MHRSLTVSLLLLLCITAPSLRAQEKEQKEKPMVALVLSGGGAKGIAHIPLLQTLDSLGIVPDLVVGTSMGSVVGGFYSMGYSGDSIAHIAENADWGELLGGDISLWDVSMEEKSEFKRHLVDFDVIEGKPKVNSGLLKDQKLREFITALAYPVYKISDFDDLPIPYRAMTTDMVEGKEYLFSEGSISLAMRASMSIPGVFQPIEYDSTLLVDGGVVNNFPVDIAKKLGADIIIGSDVSGGMQPKDKLNSIPSLVFQAAMLTSNLKSPESREMCDILVDHVPHLTYSTGDFDKSDAIYLEGKLAVDESMSKLVALSNQLQGFEQRVHKLPDVEDAFALDTIIYTDISESNLELVKARIDIEPGETYSSQEMIDAIDRAMGTTLFKQITYEAFFRDSLLGVELRGYEHSPHQVKGSLHYDSYRSVGILVNYTGRNVIGNASRIVITADIAVQPRFRIQYQKTFGEQKNWWWRTEVLGEFLKQKFFLQGEIADNLKSRYVQFDNQLNYNLNSRRSYIGMDLSYEYNRLLPEVDPSIKDNILSLDRYTFKNLELGAHYYYSRFDQVFYPDKGMLLRGFVSRSLLHDVDLIYSDPDFDEVIGSTNGFTKFGIDFEYRTPLSAKTTGIIGTNLSFIAQDALKGDDISFTDYGYSAKYSMGGNLIAPRRGSYIFPGLHEDELFVTQMMNLQLGLQWKASSKIFIIPHFNLASIGFDDFSEYFEDAFSPSGNWSQGFETSSIISAGAQIAYNSFLGPLNFDVSWVNDIDKVRVFFSVGLTFNRSN